jgi:hypothetical protein
MDYHAGRKPSGIHNTAHLISNTRVPVVNFIRKLQVSVRIRIQLFHSMRIRIWGAKLMRIRAGQIRNRILVRLCLRKKLDFDMKNILHVVICYK